MLCTVTLRIAAHAQSVSVAPSSAMVGVGFTQQFTATVTGLSNTAVTWSVAGKGVGNATVGTITPAGLYTAPLTLPGQNPVTVRATASDGKTFGSVYVLIEPLGPTLTSVSPNPLPVGSFNITVTGTGFLPGALIFVGGVQLPTTFVSSTSLKAAGYEGTTQSQPVKVRNPGSLFSNIITVPFASCIPHSRFRPATASVALGAKQQFTATSSATWSASAGTITAAGLFTAPVTMPSSSSVSITAISASNQTATATVTLLACRAIAHHRFACYCQRHAGHDAAIHRKRSIRRDMVRIGRLHQQHRALYRAVGHACVQYRHDQSHRDGQPTGTATVTLVAGPSPITVTPATANVTLGLTQQFTATGQSGVTWSASAGSISSTGLFTAPGVMPASSTVTIKATGTGNQSGAATVTLIAPPSPITVSPAAANVALGATQQFTATGQASVTWSASAGSITAAGLFTAPSSMPALNTVTITANGSGNQIGTAMVTLTGVANPQMTTAAAHRFLQQAGFGPTPADVAHLQTIGFQAWLNEQFAMAPVSNYNAALVSSQEGIPTLFLANAVTNPDQLRQKVGFALSQITVISITKLIWNNNIVPFENLLLNDAFTNYRQILGDVTLSSVHGLLPRHGQ